METNLLNSEQKLHSIWQSANQKGEIVKDKISYENQIAIEKVPKVTEVPAIKSECQKCSMVLKTCPAYGSLLESVSLEMEEMMLG